MTIDPTDFSPEDAAVYEMRMARLLEIQHYYEHWITPLIGWFYIQATEAMHSELWLPACTSFLNGIEASLRITLKLKSSNSSQQQLVPLADLNDMATMSNGLLRRAHQEGLPAELLQFPYEQDMLAKITSGAPRLPYAEIVRLRHSFCHGNILEYIESMSEGTLEPIRFFTPECCREQALILSAISKSWVVGLHQYWIDNGLLKT